MSKRAGTSPPIPKRPIIGVTKKPEMISSLPVSGNDPPPPTPPRPRGPRSSETARTDRPAALTSTSTADHSKASVYAGAKRIEGEITVSYFWATGRSLGYIGRRVGWLWVHMPKKRGVREWNRMGRVSIRSCGPVQIGMTRHIVAVAEGSKCIYLARNGHLWRHRGVLLPTPAPAMGRLEKIDQVAYADWVVRWFAEQAEPLPEMKLSHEAVGRYHKLVKALVDSRVVDAAAKGFTLTPASLSRGVSEEWTTWDLLTPRCPTLLHSLLVALVLALPEAKAVGLIELGGLIEFRIPVVSADAALALWQQANALLARLCSEWWSRGYLTDWTMVGSIEKVFRYEYARMLNQAWNRDSTIESTVQVGGPVGPPPAEALIDPETEVRADSGSSFASPKVAPKEWDAEPDDLGIIEW